MGKMLAKQACRFVFAYPAQVWLQGAWNSHCSGDRDKQSSLVLVDQLVWLDQRGLGSVRDPVSI